MYDVIENPRNGCLLHGELLTISEMKGIVPIVHSNPGCGLHAYLSGSAGSIGNGYFYGENIPSTDSQERHIIFGGASRLREQIKNTFKVIDGRLYVVLNSCESSMVGDDIEAMTKEAYEQGEAVICSINAGFHGDDHMGYSTIITDLLKKTENIADPVLEDGDDRPIVNIFGIIPHSSPSFRGDLEELKRIFAELGVRLNTFFNIEDALNQLKKAHKAKLSISFSKWGLPAAKYLKEKDGIEYLALHTLPLGYEELSELIKKVLDALNVTVDAEALIEEEKKKYVYYYNSLSEEVFSAGLNGNYALVGDEESVIRYGSFIKNSLGGKISIAIVTDPYRDDDPDKEYEKETEEILGDLSDNILRTKDGREIRRAILHSGAQMIIGSSLERSTADKLEIPLIEVNFPVYKKIFANKTYIAVNGALNLISDILNSFYETEFSRTKRLISEL